MRGSPLPDPRTPRRPGYLDRLLETGPARVLGAVRVPHQIRWAPVAAPGADADAEPEPHDGAAGRPYAKPGAALAESGVGGPAPATRRRYPPAPGVPPQRQASDAPTAGPAAADRRAGETWRGVAATAALGQLNAVSLRLDPPGPAEGGPGSPASETIQAQAGPQTTPAVTRESRRTQPQHAPSVHIGSVEVRLTAPPAPPAAPSLGSPAPAVTRLSRPRPPFGLGQV
jgi:hypothetical protein